MGLDARAIERLIYQQSGLLGVSGISSDMRTLLASGDPRAAEAVSSSCQRGAREIGSLAAALGGLDALVFDGRHRGERGAGARARVERHRLAWIDAGCRGQCCQWSRISADGPARAWVIPTNEELMIARHAQAFLY